MVTKIPIADLKGDTGPVSPESIVDAHRSGDNIVLEQLNGDEIDLGNLRGLPGLDGSNVIPTQTAIESVLTAQKGATSGIVPMATGSDWSDAARKLHAQQSSRGASEINVLVFNADPTGAADSTTAINTAITTAKTFNVGSVFIPAGRYLINGTIAITHEVLLRGQYMAYAPSNGGRTSGTVLVAGTNDAGAPVIEAKNPTAGGYLAGVGIEDIFVLGSSGWTSGAGAKDRVGIRLHKVISEYKISGVMVTGFLRQGIHLEEAYDGTMVNVRIMFCGTDGTLAALHLSGTAQGNTNSLHAFGIHIENCPYILKVEGDSRHNSFVSSKFELFSTAPLNSPMFFGDSRETTFVGCYFVSRNADDPYYSDSTVQPHFIRIGFSTAVVTMVDCNMNNAPYTGVPTVEPGSGSAETYEGGARWVRVTSGRFQSKGGTVRAAWSGPGMAPFILQKGSSFTEATIYTGAKGGTRTLFELNGQARVTGCEIMPQDAAAAPTAGALFNCTGARNIIGPNIISGAVAGYMAAAAQQTVIPSGVDTIAYTSGNSVDLGFVSPYATEYFNLQMAAATNVSQFVGGWLNREVTIRFGNANTTLVNSGNLILKGAANANPPTNSYMKFIALSATVWAEVSRSF